MIPGEGGLCRAERRGLAGLAYSRLGQLAGHITVPGERGWCMVESRETGWAGLVGAWTGRCPVKSVCRLIF